MGVKIKKRERKKEVIKLCENLIEIIAFISGIYVK